LSSCSAENKLACFQLRPEFVQCAEVSLSADALCGWGALGSGVHNTRVAAALARLESATVRAFANELEDVGPSVLEDYDGAAGCGRRCENRL
jgi:hypothetical protein